MCRKRSFATDGRGRRPAPAAVCRIPCLILCLADQEQHSAPAARVFVVRRRRAVRPLHIRKNDKRGGRQDVHLPEYRGFGPLQQRYWGTPAT